MRYIDTIKTTIDRVADVDNSQNSRHRDADALPVREFFAADVEGVESVRAVGAVFEEVFFCLCQLLTGFVLAEAEAATCDTCGLDGEDKVIVVLTVEERHQPLLPGEALVDEEVLLIVPHRVAEVHVFDTPAVPLELVDDHPSEVLVVDGIVSAEGGAVVVEHDRLVAVRGIVCAEVGDKFWELALKLDVERLDHVEPSA